MLELIIAIIMAFSCHNPKCTHTFKEHQGIIMTTDDDTGGQTSHPPPPRP